MAKHCPWMPNPLSYFLRNLGALGYTAKTTPLLPEGQSKNVRYQLADPLLRFWFQFLFENLSMIQHLGPEQAFQRLVRPRLDAYFASCFEAFCRQRLLEIYYHQEQIPDKSETGEYWSDKIQIDVVGKRGDGRIDLGECKWGAVPQSTPPSLLLMIFIPESCCFHVRS
jgi:AAA+ ATPase superfamily predicted ATPase